MRENNFRGTLRQPLSPRSSLKDKTDVSCEPLRWDGDLDNLLEEECALGSQLETR